MLQTRVKRLQDEIWLGGKNYSLRITLETEIWPYYQMVYTQPRISPGERNKILWDFEIQTDHLIPARILDLMIINKKNLPSCELCHLGEQQKENQRKRKERQLLGPCQRTKNDREHESDGDINYNYWDWSDPQRLGKGARRVGN